MAVPTLATRRRMITAALERRGETWEDMVASTLTPDELDRKFDSSEGGAAFTLWTRHRVYFPALYDVAERVESVPRDPCDERTPRVGHI